MNRKEKFFSSSKESCQDEDLIVKLAEPSPTTMSDLLDENELDDALKNCPDWDVQDSTIVRSVEFENFEEAIEFVNTVADLAEEAQHHPEINVSYSVVTLTLTTTDEGGVTTEDIEMAQRLDNLID